MSWLGHFRISSLRGKLLLSMILCGFVITGFYLGFHIDAPVQLQHFQSHVELTWYVQSHHPPRNYRWGWGLEGGITFSTGDTSPALQGTSGYSTTNVQVEGVDEPDSVKTDGTYIYTISDGKVAVVDAYPVETAHLVSWIDPVGTPLALFLWNASRLAVISQVTDQGDGGNGYSIVLDVYQVAPPTSILLLQRISLDDYYVSARLIDKYLYLIVTEWITEEQGAISLPSITIGGFTHIIPAEAIYYDPDTYDHGFCYYHLLALDVSNPESSPDLETFLGGTGTCTIYSSLVNLYLAVSHFDFRSDAIVGRSTAIHRFALVEGQLSYETSGQVPGFLINQFALDEYGGYLRVATTSQLANFPLNTIFVERSWTQVSNVYILDQALTPIGALEGLAPGESIYSVRFLDTVCFLVTFWNTDPLFVIDLSIPTAPYLQGELIIPGYSDYLHPLGDNQLLGLGKDVKASETNDWWWYQGLKISLFNATNPYYPIESAKLILGVRGTESSALHDHHAVLYHPDQQLLVIPVFLAEYTDNSTHYPYDYGTFVWQGAYIFHLDPATASIELRHRITHLENTTILQDAYTQWQPYCITRSLYINDVLYTLSPAILSFHNLTDFTPLGTITLTGA
jgi:inhibitor of cysteine peptidase